MSAALVDALALLGVGIYARISKDKGHDAEGVSRQVADGRELIGRHLDWRLFDTYVDNDTSATKGKPRAQYDRLMADVAARNIQVIIVFHQGRLWRNRRQRAEGIELLAKHRIRIVATKGQDVDLSTAAGRAYVGLVGEFDTLEVEQASERIVRMLEERAADGQPHGGQRPYGYGVPTDQLHPQTKRPISDHTKIVDAEADVIHDVADRLLDGKSLRSIVIDLNARGVPTPNGSEAWTTRRLKKIMTNPRIAGRLIYKGVDRGEGKWPKILDLDTFEAVSGLLLGRTTPPGWTNRSRHLLTGIARCGKCGAALRGQVPTTGKKIHKRSYLCPVPERGGCLGIRRQADPVDAYVEAAVVARLSRPDIRAALLVRGAPNGAEILEVDRAIEAAEARAAAIGTALADDDPNDEVTRLVRRAAMEKVRGDLDRLRRRRAQMAAPVALAGLLDVADVPLWWYGPYGEIAAVEPDGERVGGAPIARRRALIAALADIRILPGAHGRTFNPSLVEITWRDLNDDDTADATSE